MAAVRRGQEPMRVELPNGFPSTSNETPPISALFLIYFDIKAGYTISWKRSLHGIQLEGAVEYKSLPSGLHTVKEDLIYFVHDRHAGLSAFVNAPAAAESRNARMIAVGVLVQLSYGRLGRCWKHAEALKVMGQQLAIHPSETKALEEYWQTHKAQDGGKPLNTESLIESPSSIMYRPIRKQPPRVERHGRERSISNGTVRLPPAHIMSENHPAWSLQRLLSTFGPLIFPIYRAALLRQRILISCHAPVQEICDFVYDISVLSNIPMAVSELISEAAPSQRLRPLFTVGVHDIAFLEEDWNASVVHAGTSLSDEGESNELDEVGRGWIACTTDGILATKEKLFDVLITMPLPHATQGSEKVWPKVLSSRGVEIKATQRDLRRYGVLKWSLARATMPQKTHSIPSVDRTYSSGIIGDGLRRTLTSGSATAPEDPMLDIPETDTIVEPQSWSALAYTGYMWWASAGERQVALDDEFENDSSLLDDLDVDPHTPKPGRSRQLLDLSSASENTGDSAKLNLSIIAYFHRMTTNILTILSDIVDATDSGDEREDAPLDDGIDDVGEDMLPMILITSADVTKMGLDSWSNSDKEHIEQLTQAYFGRKARVEGRTVDVCGVRIC